jgi:VWFA-related protein
MLRSMMRCLGGFTLCLMPLISLAQSGTSAATAPASSNSTVTVLIHGANKRGNPVALSQTSLTVYADRQQAQITELEAANNVPLRFVLMLDLSRSDRTNLLFEKKAAAQIFEALAKDGNEGYVGAFSHEIEISARPLQLPEVNAFLSQAEASGGTAMYDAIVEACDTLGHGIGAPAARRILFLISDGQDSQSLFSETKAIRFAQHHGVAVFALALVPTLPIGPGGAVLKQIAQETGGTAVVLSSPDEFLDKLLGPLETQYFLTFTPPPASPSTGRHLEVKSTDHSIRVFAPSGYAAD